MTDTGCNLDRVLVLEMVRVTEAAAIAAAKLIGRGDEKAADAAAVEAMRTAFNTLYMDGTIVIGEGERDEAPMLYIGERVGLGRPDSGERDGEPSYPKIHIALYPLEDTTNTRRIARVYLRGREVDRAAIRASLAGRSSNPDRR